MNEHDESERASEVRLKALRCRRTGEQVDLDEHASCPYCFGRMPVIERGDHRGFCDYRPEVDPIHFGFPPDAARHRSG